MENTETTKSGNYPGYGIVPCGGEFALTNSQTGEIVSYHLDRESAESLALAAKDADRALRRCSNCGVGPFFTVWEREHPFLCSDCSQIASHV